VADAAHWRGVGRLTDDRPGGARQHLTAQEAVRRQRDDAFSRLLGDEWVEVEPGIYRKQTRPAPSPSLGSHMEPGGPSFDQLLVDALSLLDANDDTANQPAEPAPRRNV
jgi:hypothetical protein